VTPQAPQTAPDDALLNKRVRCRVVGVTDGDTITVLTASKRQEKVRLEGIDAPESAQPFGTQAKKALSELVFGKDVDLHLTARDRYGRFLAHVYSWRDVG
jgi:endonuclease YncB( thermonuclease family)